MSKPFRRQTVIDAEDIDPIAELEILEAEIRRRMWQRDPNQWVAERLGDTLWSGQKRINDAVARHRRVIVKSCHEIGKSFDISLLVGWWLDTHPVGDAFVVTSATTGAQVRSVLWREIGRVHSRGKLAGRVNQTEWLMTPREGKEELVAFGRKPDEYDPTAFQGIHAPFVLVIFDEANGIRGGLWEAADSLIANDDSKIIAIGNPDDPTGEFFENSKPGSGWHVVEIGAFESPNFTGEPMPQRVLKQLIGRTYVEEKRKKWAPKWIWVDEHGSRSDAVTGIRCVPPDGAREEDTNPLWQSKVLGRFPERKDAGGLIPIAWIASAQRRELRPSEPNELGVDIGAGGDDTAVCHRRGCVYRILRSDNDPDTMAQTGKIIEDLRTTGARRAKIDKIGIGWGVVNRGKELNKPFIGINVGEGASEETDYNVDSDNRFMNLKAELWWHVRDLFEAGQIDIDPEDDDLAGELASIRYTRMSNGKIKIEDKRKDAQGKPMPSPNRAEALMLAAAPTDSVIVDAAPTPVGVSESWAIGGNR